MDDDKKDLLQVSSASGKMSARQSRSAESKKHDEETGPATAVTITPPKPLSLIFNSFQSFYLNKPTNKGRRLNFIIEHGSCTLKVNIGNSYYIKTNIAQALILLNINPTSKGGASPKL